MIDKKGSVEKEFWERSLDEYISWYSGKISSLYGHNSPADKDKIKVNNIKDSAVLTWQKLHQEPKYLEDLKLTPTSFKNKKILDIGSGPIPSGVCFKDAEIYCLDPLWGEYLKIGYPAHYYSDVRIINARSENIPVEDNFFDAVISVNAIDHVDDLDKTSKEIKRVLKPDGKFAMHVHYHQKTPAEPLEINDSVFKSTFKWCKNLKKHSVSDKKYGSVAGKGETFVLWRNF
jgi:SAM-dependent methyltransferase